MVVLKCPPHIGRRKQTGSNSRTWRTTVNFIYLYSNSRRILLHAPLARLKLTWISLILVLLLALC